MNLKKTDPQIYRLVKQEERRQRNKLTLIPSENYASPAVRQALACVLTNKYSEGEPGKRYYQGNELVDQIELLANQRAFKIFGLNVKKWHVNCKAISASIANLAVISAMVSQIIKFPKKSLIMKSMQSCAWGLTYVCPSVGEQISPCRI